MSSFRPIFFIGFGRSGTTVMFEAFSRHEALGWPSAYTEWFPNKPWINGLRRLLDNSLVRLVGKKGQYGDTIIGNRFLPQPNEAYAFWDLYTCKEFSRNYLRDQFPDQTVIRRTHEAVRKLVMWQGRSRFAAKLTGPPRITFLNGIFPDAKFVHVIRDGRAVVHSLLHTRFWREKGGLSQPFWSGGLTDHDLRRWHNSDRDPGVLAALQWKRIVEIARVESGLIDSSRYCEIRYEDFIESPHDVLRKIYEFCDLEDSSLGHGYLMSTTPLLNMNHKFRVDFSADYIEKIGNLMEPMLRRLHYSHPVQ